MTVEWRPPSAHTSQKLMNYRQQPNEHWLEYFRATGYPTATPLGGGVEGATYRLRAGRVAKVWAHKSESELARYSQFYADLGAHTLPFETPRIISIQSIDGSLVTEELELPGHPLQEHLVDGQVTTKQAAEDLVAILAALREIPWFGSAKQLPVLGERMPLLAEGRSWPAAMDALIGRKFEAYRRLLVRDVPDAEDMVSRLRHILRNFRIEEKGIVHGDLFGRNVLVDDQQRVSAVLDFGFMTCAGDPDFDAAVLALIADQYGAQSARSEALFDGLILDRFQADPSKLLVYKAAYAVITSGHFSKTGSDGHYPWCVNILNRPEVKTTIESA